MIDYNQIIRIWLITIRHGYKTLGNHENMAAYIDIKSWSTLLQVTEKPLTVIPCTTMVQLCLNHE